MSKYCFKLDATNQNNIKKIENTVEMFKNEIILMSLTRAQTDLIFNLTQNVIDVYSDVIKSEVPQSEKKMLQKFDEFHIKLKTILQA